MADASIPGPEAQVRALYELAESRTTQAFEELVSKPSFGVLLARSAENVAAMARIGSDWADLVLRNLRPAAGGRDAARPAASSNRGQAGLPHAGSGGAVRRACVSSEDVTYLERPGGHFGLMADSKAKHEICGPSSRRLVARALGPLR